MCSISRTVARSDSQAAWENVKFKECFKYELAFSKEKNSACGMCLMTGGSARWNCCAVRFWCLENGDGSQVQLRGEGSRMALDVIHQCREHGYPFCCLEKSKCLSLLGFCELFQNSSLSEAGQTTRLDSSVPWVALQAVIKCPIVLVPRIGFLLPCVVCTAWGSTREVITPCWSLTGTGAKPEAAGAKFGTYSFKLRWMGA